LIKQTNLIKFDKINYPTPVKTEIHTPATPPGPIFIQKSDFGSCSSFGKNRRLPPESTPASGSVITSGFYVPVRQVFRTWMKTLMHCGFGQCRICRDEHGFGFKSCGFV